MAFMEKYLATLVERVSNGSKEFAARVQASVPSIIADVGHYSNEAYLLRSFVSLRADNDGYELALTVDITRPPNGGMVSIESDVCLDDGTIIASGPTARFDMMNSNSAAEASFWSKNFDEFLEKAEPEVVQVLSEMVANQEKLVRMPRLI
jgi:hypothetical protein